MAIVMTSVKNANAMFRYVAGGAVTPLLSNYEGQLKDEIRDAPRTIIVHSKMEDGEAAAGETGRYIRELAEVFRRNARYGFSDSDRPEEIIRRVMNTVGTGIPPPTIDWKLRARPLRSEALSCRPCAGPRGPELLVLGVVIQVVSSACE